MFSLFSQFFHRQDGFSLVPYNVFRFASTARPVRDLLKSRNMTRWYDLLEKADLLKDLDTARNVTLLVPSEKALKTPEVS